jgi:hypothetical protein
MAINLIAEIGRMGEEEVMNDSFFMIIDRDSLEKIDNMRLPCLNAPIKFILKVKTWIARIASYIITNPIFEYSTLVVILLNSAFLAAEDPNQTT